jgi:hypothetical protein
MKKCNARCLKLMSGSQEEEQDISREEVIAALDDMNGSKAADRTSSIPGC